MHIFYVPNDTVVIFDRAIYTRETGKEEGWILKSSIGARPARSIPFLKQRPACLQHGGEQPVGSYALLFTRDKKGKGEKRVINTVTISNNDNFKNRKNKVAIHYWPGK
jgi:hypothetical protein